MICLFVNFRTNVNARVVEQICRNAFTSISGKNDQIYFFEKIRYMKDQAQ